MAAGALAPPGTDAGPCRGECEHTDCAATKRMAEALCPRCDEAIGFDVRHYRIDPERYGDEWTKGGTTLTDTTGAAYKLVHARCLEA